MLGELSCDRQVVRVDPIFMVPGAERVGVELAALELRLVGVCCHEP